MKTGRRNFLKGLLGAVATTQVFAEKQEPAVLEEKFKAILEDPKFNCVILEYRGDKWKQRDVVYKAVHYIGQEQLQRGDIAVWADDTKVNVKLYQSSNDEYAGIVTIKSADPDMIPTILNKREQDRKAFEKKQFII